MSEKDLDYYINLPYKVEITPEEDGTGFNAAIPDLKGCVAFGETIEEAYEMITEIKQAWLEIALERGWRIPEPSPVEFKEYSGRFNLRLPRYLHRKLAEMAESEGTSLNQLVVAFLSEGAERQQRRAIRYEEEPSLHAFSTQWLRTTGAVVSHAAFQGIGYLDAGEYKSILRTAGVAKLMPAGASAIVTDDRRGRAG